MTSFFWYRFFFIPRYSFLMPEYSGSYGQPARLTAPSEIDGAALEGLVNFKHDYPEAEAYFLYRGKESLMIKDIHYIPCEEFLLQLKPERSMRQGFAGSLTRQKSKKQIERRASRYTANGLSSRLSSTRRILRNGKIINLLFREASRYNQIITKLLHQSLRNWMWWWRLQ